MDGHYNYIFRSIYAQETHFCTLGDIEMLVKEQKVVINIGQDLNIHQLEINTLYLIFLFV